VPSIHYKSSKLQSQIKQLAVESSKKQLPILQRSIQQVEARTAMATKTIQVCFEMVENKSASDFDRRLNSIVWTKSDEKVISVNNFAWRGNSKIWY